MAYLHHGNLQCALVSPGKLDCHWRYLASFLLRKLARFLCENLALSLRKFGLLSVEIGLLSVEKFVWLSQWRLGLLSVEKLGFCFLGNLSSHSTVCHAVFTKFCVWLRAGSQADDPAHCAVIQWKQLAWVLSPVETGWRTFSAPSVSDSPLWPHTKVVKDRTSHVCLLTREDNMKIMA